MNNLNENWIIDQDNFQKLYEINIGRQIELLEPKILGGPISKNQLINMKVLGQELIDILSKQKISLSEFFTINEKCIAEILNSGKNTANFNLIQLDDLSTFSNDEKREMVDIKENQVQFAVNFDDENEYYLFTDVAKPINITQNIKIYTALFTKNIKPYMDNDINVRTKGIKTENTSIIFIPVKDFGKYKSEIYLHSALSDINFDHIFHSITHIFNFTIAISDKKLSPVEMISLATTNAAQDVWHTCKPYCSGSGGGII